MGASDGTWNSVDSVGLEGALVTCIRVREKSCPLPQSVLPQAHQSKVQLRYLPAPARISPAVLPASHPHLGLKTHFHRTALVLDEQKRAVRGSYVPGGPFLTPTWAPAILSPSLPKLLSYPVRPSPAALLLKGPASS